MKPGAGGGGSSDHGAPELTLNQAWAYPVTDTRLPWCQHCFLRLAATPAGLKGGRRSMLGLQLNT